MVSVFPIQIGVAQSTIKVDPDDSDQRFISQTSGLPLKSMLCLPSPQEGTDSYTLIIYNSLLANGDFGRRDFSSVPYQNAYRRKPNDPSVNLELGNALFAEYMRVRDEKDTEQKLRFYRDIVEAYQNALRLSSDDISKASASLGLGRIMTLSGEYDRAIKYYQSALQITKNIRPSSRKDIRKLESDVYVGLGVALGGLCNHSAALSAYLKAVDLKPDYPDIDFINLEAVLEKRNRLTDMIEIYQRAMKRGSNEDFSLAHLFIKLKRFNDAEVIYRKAITSGIANDMYSYYLGLGDSLKGQGKNTEATSAYQNAAEIYQPDGNFAWIPQSFRKRGLLDLAIVVQRKELSNVPSSYVPSSIAGHIYMGELLEEKGDSCGAITEYEKALEMKTGDQYPLGWLEEYQKSAKKGIEKMKNSCPLKRP